MKSKYGKVLLVLLLFFSFLFLSPRISFGVNSILPVQPVPQNITNEQFNNLKSDVEKLRDENYQNVLETSQRTIDKVNQYSDRLTFLATVLGLFLTGFGVFFGINFYFTKREFSEQLNEIKVYVDIAKQNANLVKKLAEETNKQSAIIFQGVKDYQKNKKEMSELLDKAKRTKTMKVKEIDDALTRIQEKESELNQRMLQAVNNIQSMSSQASIISGSVSFPSAYNLGTIKSVSPYPSSIINDYIAKPEPISFPAEKCSRCGNPISLSEGYVPLSGEKLCPACKIKEFSESPK